MNDLLIFISEVAKLSIDKLLDKVHSDLTSLRLLDAL